MIVVLSRSLMTGVAKSVFLNGEGAYFAIFNGEGTNSF